MKDINKKYLGVFIKMLDIPAMYLIAKNAGFDFVFFDNEHSSFSKNKMHDLMLFGNNIGLPTFVRVSELNRLEISQTLDNGATGIMVPMIETKEQAEKLVEFSKYTPIGKRGYSSGAHTNYGPGGNHRQNMDIKNETVVTISQIETEKGILNAEEIISTPGIDACIVGPVDLSISLGNTGNIMHPNELSAIEKVIGLCKKYNKAFGIIGTNEILSHFRDSVQYFVSAVDFNIIRDGFKNSCEKNKTLINND